MWLFLLDEMIVSFTIFYLHVCDIGVWGKWISYGTMMINGVTTGTWPRILGSHLVVLPGPDRIALKTRRCNGRWNWPRPWHTGAEGQGGFPRGMLFFLGGSEKTWNTYAYSIFKGDYKMFTSISNYFRLKRCSSSDVVVLNIFFSLAWVTFVSIFSGMPQFSGVIW